MTAVLQVLIGPVDGSITQDITSHVLNNTVKVEDGAGALLSTASFDVLDKVGTLTGIGVEREVIVNWDGVLIHRGIIKTCARVRNRSVFWRYYKCKTQDLTCLMADNVVTGGWPMGAYGPPDHNPLSDSATIDMLLATYGTHGVLGTVAGAVQTLVAPGSMPYIDFMSMTLYRAMAAICQVSGGHFWVDDNRVLHYAITETNPAPWGISDTPNYRAPSSAWSDVTAYVPGNLVESDGEVWTCVLSNTALRPFPPDYRAAMLITSPVGYWRLGEASGTVAVDQMGANDGAYSGSPTLGVAGLLTGDPDTAVTLGAGTMWKSGAFPLHVGAFSFGLWYTGPGADSAVFASGLAAQGGRLRLSSSTYASFFVGTTECYYSPRPTSGPVFLVGTYDGTNARLYQQGVLVATLAAANPSAVTSDAVYLAGFTAAADESAIWNRALTPAEDAGLYAVGTGTVYWESLGSPSIANTFPYETLTLPDDTVSLANAIFIGGTGIYGFVEDSESIAVYGRHEDGVRDTSVKDMLRFNAVGNAMLDQNKYPVQAATLTHRKPGLRAGMVVNLTDHVWGLVSTDHGIDFLISKIITTPDPSGIIEQELQVSPAWGPWSGS